MGAKDSKRSCLSYEDAVKRMTDAELKRVCEAFKRLTNGGQLLSCDAFTQNVLGDGVPPKIANWLYTACGGNSKGIALRDLICGLVLLTKGTQEEKIKFLWNLYCNDSGTYITRSEFQSALQTEGTLPPPDGSNKTNLAWDLTLVSLFCAGQDKVAFEDFRNWILYNKEATVLSKWLLSNPCVSLSSDLETPTFYQTLAGVTHLEEQDICKLEKCFWALQTTSVTGHLDFNCLMSLVCPPVPPKACKGLFLALDVNSDDHVDFKELCCGISAACRGPLVERMRFCFKIFDMDRDSYLNPEEVQYMTQTLRFIANENKQAYAAQLLHENFAQPKKDAIETLRNDLQKSSFEMELVKKHNKALESMNNRLDGKGGLTQEDFLMWSVEDNSLVMPLLELLFQVCHVSLGLRPQCRHDEYEIVTGWLEREQRRGYHVGQFWYLISSDWWQQWLNYTTAPRSNLDFCNCRQEPRIPIEEGIVCDESLISNTTDSNDFNSNSMESMGDLLSRGDSCSIASSSGVSSSSGTGSKKSLGKPGHIDNSSLVAKPMFNARTLTGEGGRLRRDIALVQRRDFELVPDSLWKALSMWYGGPLPLPRQVIKPPGHTEVELELYPLNLRILRHQSQPSTGSTSSWGSVVGGYGAAALSTAGLATTVSAPTSRFLAHTAAFSRLATVEQVLEFLCHHLDLRAEEARLWLLREHSSSLLDDENVTLQDLGIVDADQILLEVRNKDLTWPEEMGQLASGGQDTGLSVNRRPTICLPPGVTGLHNLGNTCFMNAALQAVSNTRPLTLYFKRDGQLSELNCTNPLGTKGVVAKRYTELCRELWAGSTRSVAPLKLRYCVMKHSPHFGGGGQHDSQEFLAWLLDSLHEDLNRVPRKQYTELKDSGGRPDEIVAEEAWQHHLTRNHSIITDLFYGQLKSKVTCQICGHESVRFDPFNLLSLPLPMESYTLCEVLVMRLNGNCPVKYGVRLNSDAKYMELKEQLHDLCGINPDRLLLAEVADCQIRPLLSDEARVNPGTSTQLYAYELPDASDVLENHVGESETEVDMGIPESPLARSPEVSAGSALCMPNILCFKHVRSKPESRPSRAVPLKKISISVHSGSSTASGTSESSQKWPRYLIAVHRKCVRQETYFLSQQKSKPSLFGLPLLLGFDENSTCQGLYEAVCGQVTRLLSPLPQSDRPNHATDCDDSLGYAFPFALKAVLQGGQICAICHWTKFCRGCVLPCSDELVAEKCRSGQGTMYIAIDWDPTALHLRYQSNREKLWVEHESVAICRKLHTEPIDLDYCLKAFTSEECLETKYHCSSCQEKQPATKKLQIWRLPPILIIHLKRFDCVNNKWVKTHKVVNFPFKDFDPTAYLASVPQETILRHRQLTQEKSGQDELEASTESQPERIAEECEPSMNGNGVSDVNRCNNECAEKSNGSVYSTEQCKLLKGCDKGSATEGNKPANKSKAGEKVRARLESTSLAKTPIIDEHLRDYHQHQLLPGQDPFDLKYQLYAVVSHAGLLDGGHYISYACNPNGHWYYYNDSSCREVLTDLDSINSSKSTPKGTGCTPLARRKNMPRKLSTSSNNSDDSERRERAAPLATIDTSLMSSDSLAASRSGSVSSVDNCGASPENVSENKTGCSEKLLRDSPYASRKSLNSFKCPYGDVKVPKIDTSAAYILFYERSGLDYKPYLPTVVPNGAVGKQVPVEEVDENEPDRPVCSIQ